MDLEARLASVAAALVDGEARLSTDLGGHRELTGARLWRGQVLVDWEPDPQAGGCLLRPPLLRRLTALHARVELDGDVVRLTAPGRLVAALSAQHADLVSRLGGARRVELQVVLRFAGAEYRGGEEAYYLVQGEQRQAFMRLTADVHPPAHLPGQELPRNSLAPT